MHCRSKSITSLVVQLFVQQRSNKPRSRKKRLCAYLCTKSKKRKRQTPSEQEKTPLCRWLPGCKPKSGCFFHPLYRRGYSLLLPLQITACLVDLNIAIKLFPSFCLRRYCAAEASGLHCPRRSLLPHSPSPSPPLQWS